MTVRTTLYLSPSGDKNFRQAHIEVMVDFQSKVKPEQIVTYPEIIEAIGAKNKDEACDIFRLAAIETRRRYQIHFRNVCNVGYKRVVGGMALESSKREYKQGLRKAGRALDKMHDIDRKELTAEQCNEVAGYLSMNGRLQLMHDTSGG